MCYHTRVLTFLTNSLTTDYVNYKFFGHIEKVLSAEYGVMIS